MSAFVFHDPAVCIAYVGLPVVLWLVLFWTRRGMNMEAVEQRGGGREPGRSRRGRCERDRLS